MGLAPQDLNISFSMTRPETIVWQRTSEIKSLMRLTAENIIGIGQKLTEVKEELEHGTFQSWLRTEFEWSEQQPVNLCRCIAGRKPLKTKISCFLNWLHLHCIY